MHLNNDTLGERSTTAGFSWEPTNKPSSIVNPIFEKHKSFIFDSFTKNQILTAK
jgi:hypothetical protein